MKHTVTPRTFLDQLHSSQIHFRPNHSWNALGDRLHPLTNFVCTLTAYSIWFHIHALALCSSISIASDLSLFIALSFSLPIILALNWNDFEIPIGTAAMNYICFTLHVQLSSTVQLPLLGSLVQILANLSCILVTQMHFLRMIISTATIRVTSGS